MGLIKTLYGYSKGLPLKESLKKYSKGYISDFLRFQGDVEERKKRYLEKLKNQNSENNSIKITDPTKNKSIWSKIRNSR